MFRLVELEHGLLRSRLDDLRGDSDGARLLEGLIVLGSVLQQRLSHLLGLCRDIGRL
ncbi:hypothetical protein AmDm5_0702 [Acetobacter malorum]|nr:hypothetical protein AmDm5_0702 [Acetobacter malorum]